MNFVEVKDKVLENIGRKTTEKARSPVKIFEEKFGVEGLSADYNPPKGFDTLKDFEVYFYNEFAPFYNLNDSRLSDGEKNILKDHYNKFDMLGKLNNVYDEFVKVNPEIEDIPRDEKSFSQTLDIIYGACSGYNIYDIDFFVNDYDMKQVEIQRKFEDDMNKKKAGELGVDIEDIKKENEFKFGWILSEKTIKRATILFNKQGYFNRKKEKQYMEPMRNNQRVIASDEEELRIRMGSMYHKYIDFR